MTRSLAIAGHIQYNFGRSSEWVRNLVSDTERERNTGEGLLRAGHGGDYLDRGELE